MIGSAQPLQPQESLAEAFVAFARSQITIFLALSLAFAVPLSCQQRSMMSLYDLSPSALHAMNQGYATTSPGVSLTGMWLVRPNQSAGASFTLGSAFPALARIHQLVLACH